MPKKDFSTKKKISLPQALFSPIIDPVGAIDSLVSHPEGPPHTLALLALFILTTIAPPLLYTSFEGIALVDGEYLQSVATTTILTGILTLILVSFSTRAVSNSASIKRDFAVLVYSTAPITMFMALIIFASYIWSGDFNVVRFIATGVPSTTDPLTQILPYGLRGVFIITLIDLMYGYSSILRSSTIMGGILSCLTIFLLLGAFIIAMQINEAIQPFSSGRVISFFYNFLNTP
jgi:hypothetical protein